MARFETGVFEFISYKATTMEQLARPEGTAPDEGKLEDAFARLGICYKIVEHKAVFTIEEALAHVPPIDGVKTKNVFLRDAKGNRHFLAIVPHHKRVDLIALARAIGSTKLSMGSAERLQRCLGVTSGAVSIFSLINDGERLVELIVDAEIWQAARIQGHPLRNTATMSISHSELETFLDHIQHRATVIPVPAANT